MSSPCAVPGCRATTTRYTNWICSQHWQICCPARSPHRRTYLRFFREAKKLGLTKDERWPAGLERRFWRYWNGLVRRAYRIEHEGNLVSSEVDKMFGWNE